MNEEIIKNLEMKFYLLNENIKKFEKIEQIYALKYPKIEDSIIEDE
jgi:hypothetical protein